MCRRHDAVMVRGPDLEHHQRDGRGRAALDRTPPLLLGCPFSRADKAGPIRDMRLQVLILPTFTHLMPVAVLFENRRSVRGTDLSVSNHIANSHGEVGGDGGGLVVPIGRWHAS